MLKNIYLNMAFRVTRLAIPISLANVAGLLAILINMRIVGAISSYYIYILTLFLPLNFWIVSLFESFRVPAVVVAAAVADHPNKRSEMGSQLILLLFLTFIGVLLPILVFVCMPSFIKDALVVPSIADFNYFKKFAIFMLSTSFFMASFFISSAILNGIRKEKLAMSMTLMAIFTNTLLILLFIYRFNFGLFGLPLATGINYFVFTLIITFILKNENIFHEISLARVFSIDKFKRLKQLAVPVWLTYLIITLALSVYTHLLMPYGYAVVSGFGIAYRMQTLLILPAISIGVAIGIIINRGEAKFVNNNNRHTLLIGMLTCFMFYFFIVLFLHFLSVDIVSLITHDALIISSANHYLSIVSDSYIGLAVTLCFLIVLDQIGFGVSSTVLSILFFSSIIGSALLLSIHHPDADNLYYSIALVNVISAAIIFLFVLLKQSLKFYPKFLTV